MLETIQLSNFNQVELAEEERLWACALHLAPLLNFAFPLLGILAPIGIWYHHRENSTFINNQARELLNYFLLTFLVGITIICFIAPLLFFFPWLAAPFALVGLLIAPLALLPFWAAFNVYQGKEFKYPLPVRFLKTSAA